MKSELKNMEDGHGNWPRSSVLLVKSNGKLEFPMAHLTTSLIRAKTVRCYSA